MAEAYCRTPDKWLADGYIAPGMNAPSRSRDLSARDLEPILAVAAKLAAPFDLETMLAEVVDAATRVLGADRGSVWLYDRDADELVLHVAHEIVPVRIPAGTGIVGSCARTRSSSAVSALNM